MKAREATRFVIWVLGFWLLVAFVSIGAIIWLESADDSAHNPGLESTK